MRHFSFELLKESPSPALRTCAKLAQLQVEFMEHDERPLPIDICLMGALAGKCRAFEKALHYKEMEFEGALSNKRDANHVVVVEALIHINNQLRQYERLEINICSAAFGGSVEEVMVLLIVAFCCTVLIAAHLFLLILDDAIKAYTAKASQASSPHLCLDATLGTKEQPSRTHMDQQKMQKTNGRRKRQRTLKAILKTIRGITKTTKKIRFINQYHIRIKPVRNDKKGIDSMLPSPQPYGSVAVPTPSVAPKVYQDNQSKDANNKHGIDSILPTPQPICSVVVPIPSVAPKVFHNKQSKDANNKQDPDAEDFIDYESMEGPELGHIDDEGKVNSGRVEVNALVQQEKRNLMYKEANSMGHFQAATETMSQVQQQQNIT
ncbi:hypothetical protein KY285_000940 [Solanum tuberosum]|nr:hypothetical protein KY285_000940 [Solanum tuberosum]